MKKLTVAQAVKSSAKYIAITNDKYGTKRIESGFSFCVGTFYDDNLNNSNINEFACSRKMFDKILSEKASEILENSDENVMYFYKDAEFEENPDFNKKLVSSWKDLEVQFYDDDYSNRPEELKTKLNEYENISKKILLTKK